MQSLWCFLTAEEALLDLKNEARDTISISSQFARSLSRQLGFRRGRNSHPVFTLHKLVPSLRFVLLISFSVFPQNEDTLTKVFEHTSYRSTGAVWDPLAGILCCCTLAALALPTPQARPFLDGQKWNCARCLCAKPTPNSVRTSLSQPCHKVTYLGFIRLSTSLDFVPPSIVSVGFFALRRPQKQGLAIRAQKADRSPLS